MLKLTVPVVNKRLVDLFML